MHGQNQQPYAPSATDPPVYRAHHQPDGSADLSTTVAHAIADCLGIDVTESFAALHDSIDPDALDLLFQSRYNGAPRTGGTLSFFVHDYRVRVSSDGEILIEPPVRS